MAEPQHDLGVPADNVLPAYEDPGEWVLRESRLPENVTPEDSRLDDPEARDRLARILDWDDEHEL